MTNMKTQRKIYGYTDFATAIHWLNNNYNEFAAVLKYDAKLKAIFDEKYNDGCTTPCLSDCNDNEVQYLKDTFGLIFEYSKVFQKWFLIVNHFSNLQWHYVGHIYKDIEANSIDEAYEKAKSSFAPEVGELENYEATVVSISAPGCRRTYVF